MIIFSSTNFTAKANGYLDPIFIKDFYVETKSTNAKLDESYVRGKTNYEVFITKLEQDDFLILKNIFLYENDFTVVDTERGLDGTHYKFNVDTFPIKGAIENKKTKSFYYAGTFEIHKI
jgi:hypothetical protein